jgi:photosystem II stability/assembly factor-like uncharacterized protein
MFLNESMGFLIKAGSIYKTIDVGNNWEQTYFDNPDSTGYSFSGNDISYMTENVIRAVGYAHWSGDSSGAAILGTIDGGENWDLVWKYPNNYEYQSVLSSIHTVGKKAWAVGLNGMIVKYTEHDQWQVMPRVTDLPLNDVFYSDEQHGWIAGGYLNNQDFQSILLKTSNAGKTWSEKKFDKYLLSDMFFEDSLHGWAVGNDTSFNDWQYQGRGIILKTIDGGNIWTVQVEDLSAPLTALHFKDGYGWVVGGNGLILRTYDGSTWIDQNTGKTYPNKLSLSQNYPNPFNPSTKIKFTLPNAEKVKIDLYNTLGQRVEILLDQQMKAGHHEVKFNAENLSSGVYYYRIEAGEFQDVKKMVLLR